MKKEKEKENHTAAHHANVCPFVHLLVEWKCRKIKLKQINANFCGKKLLKESDLSQTEWTVRRNQMCIITAFLRSIPW